MLVIGSLTTFLATKLHEDCFNLFSFRGLDRERYKVLEMGTKGNLYLYKSALLCKSEIIKRLTEENYQLAEPNILR